MRYIAKYGQYLEHVRYFEKLEEAQDFFFKTKEQCSILDLHKTYRADSMSHIVVMSRLLS